MAREIDFQGKTKDTGKWITGNLYFSNKSHNSFELQYFEGVQIETKVTVNVLAKFFVIPETIGQYTNVLGSDGKKIYEKDIVYNGTYKGEVYWNYSDNGWRIAVTDINNQMFDTKLNSTYRVIGHRYDELVAANYFIRQGEFI